MKVYGLTGGIGMGKTTAGDLLRQRGHAVVDTDLLARQIVEPGQPALQEIQRAFGAHLVSPEGQLRRDELARLVFVDPAARQTLESITHPRIQELWRRQIETWTRESRPLAIVVIPLLFETGVESELQTTLCVACSSATQRLRLQDRGWSAEHTQQRIGAQWPIEKKIARADFVVWNEGVVEVMGEQLDRIIPPP